MKCPGPGWPSKPNLIYGGKFGDTLPSESGDAGQHRLSESQSVSLGDSYKPLRRAQIFDKGVDASMMQVMLEFRRGQKRRRWEMGQR